MSEVSSILEKAGLENKDHVYNDGGTLVVEGHIDLKADLESEQGNTFGGKMTAFLSTLDQEGGKKFLLDFNRKVESKVDVEEFKEELRTM